MRANPWLLLALALTVALLTDRVRGSAHQSFSEAQRYEDLYYLPPPGWLPVFSLSWDEAAADVLWMRALIYFGDEFVHDGRVEHVFDYAEAIVALDPKLRSAYRWAGVAGMYRPQAITPEDIERSVAFLERGARQFPNDGELLWDIGAALAYELAPIVEEDDLEAGREARERAAPYLTAAVRLGAGPEWAALANASLLSSVGRAEQAARHLEEMYLDIDDPGVRARIAARIEAMRGRARAEASLERVRALEAERRAEYRYLPATLYLLVGPRESDADLEPYRTGFRAPADE